jgi:starch synthase
MYKMKILFVASEMTPLIKVGGLADVVGSLPRALRARGHDVRVIIPQYGLFDSSSYPLKTLKKDLHYSYLGDHQAFDLNQTEYSGVPVYTIRNSYYFGYPEIYSIYDLDHFFFFSRAVFQVLSSLDWQPEIIHCHDWHTALLIMWLKKAASPYATVFTIHNLGYQGAFLPGFRQSHGLTEDWSNTPEGLPPLPSSFMAQAVLKADLVTTVSETYSREITTPELGVGLDAFLRFRQEEGALLGIVNGLDQQDWDSSSDGYLPVNYTPETFKKRALNKVALQRIAGLPVNGDVPLIGMVQRLDEQKGLDILGQAMDAALKENGVQFVILGRGRDNYESLVRDLSARYPQKVAAVIGFEEPLAHLIYAGADAFLMPSRFEPCGLGQLIAMRYGALPIVRHTGGLVDTVPEFDAALTSGNGFVFHDYSAKGLLSAIRQASTAYKNRPAWQQAAQRVMKVDFSWQASALKYEEAYRSLLPHPK